MKKHLFFAAALFALAACNNDENLPGNDPNAPVEICLAGGIEVQTRTTHNLDTQLKNGEQVHVWVDDAETGDSSYPNNILTVGDNGTLTGGETMYFPETGNNVNIYAIHGNLEDWTNIWGESIIHNVEQDQRSSVTTAGEGYAVSDLVYAKSTDVSRNGNPTIVNLTFRHLLSKIEVVLIEGQGNEGFLTNISSLQVLNTRLKAGFTLDKATAADAIKVTESGDATPISLDTDISASLTATNRILNEAVIVPQEITQDTPFIRVELTEGATFIYKIKNTTTFESGKKYLYTITVRETGLEVTSSISDWIEGTGDDDGFAEEVTDKTHIATAGHLRNVRREAPRKVQSAVSLLPVARNEQSKDTRRV